MCTARLRKRHHLHEEKYDFAGNIAADAVHVHVASASHPAHPTPVRAFAKTAAKQTGQGSNLSLDIRHNFSFPTFLFIFSLNLQPFTPISGGRDAGGGGVRFMTFVSGILTVSWAREGICHAIGHDYGKKQNSQYLAEGGKAGIEPDVPSGKHVLLKSCSRQSPEVVASQGGE